MESYEPVSSYAGGESAKNGATRSSENFVDSTIPLDKSPKTRKIKANVRSFLGDILMGNSSLSKGERTRQAVMEAAYELFLEQGYAATSMRQIAERAGLALGGIYNHFTGKEAIFSELILDRHPYRQILPIMLNAPAEDPETFVRSAAQTMLDELGKRPDFIKLMLIEIVEFNGRNMPEIIERVLPEVLPLIQRFSKQKGLLREIPPFVFFRAFLGLFFSYYITEMMIADTSLSNTQSQALDHFVEIFLHGILREASPKEEAEKEQA
jgi:AcrR family transcriptional regulator